MAEIVEPAEQLTAVEALELVSAFFDKEWPQTEVQDVQIRKVTGGFCHRLHLISRRKAVDQEPASVLIRHFGTSDHHKDPRESSASLSAAEQAVVYYEMGRRGWGPRVYGLFQGGRLEEFIDSHPLSAAESMQESVRRDVARSYARLHSLQLPLRKRNIELVIGELKKGAERKNDLVQRILAVTCPEAMEFTDFVCDTDWKHELDWVSKLFDMHECKTAIAIGDTNFLNILVKNYDSECRTVLIDYETASYGYRGIDIGGHFTERMYSWSNPESKLTGYPAPDMVERRSFCESYLKEMQDLGLEMTQHDTVPHLLLESEVGQMYQILFSVLMCIVFDENLIDPPLLAGLAHMIGLYRQLKKDFMEKYGMGD